MDRWVGELLGEMDERGAGLSMNGFWVDDYDIIK